ncbi:hypothetical protein GD1_122 [Paraglaciecola Antarctic GD virus 1]|nr:hypothetical protein GD1_122 [Paraglaciecola Antarctic GD virus 1]
MTDLRTKRLVPANATVIEVPSTIASRVAVVYQWTKEHNGKTVILAKAFVGRKTKPYFFFNFPTEQRRQARVDGFVADMATLARSYEDAKAEVTSFVRDVEVGDILYSSWGWEQTNIDFYQVTKLVGAKSVEFREIGQDRTYDGQMCGSTKPVKDQFVGGMMKKQYGKYGAKISSFQTARKWDGRSKSWSSYA